MSLWMTQGKMQGMMWNPLLQQRRFGMLALLVVIATASVFILSSWAGPVTRMEALSLNAEGALQARVSQPAKATVFYRTLGNRYQVIWDFESTQASPALLAKTDWTALFQRQWPTLVSATVQAFSGPVVRVRLEWDVSESALSTFTSTKALGERLGEPLLGDYQSQTPTLNISRALLASSPAEGTLPSSPRYATFSLPAVASPASVVTSNTSLQARIQQLEAERDDWQRKAEQQAQHQRTSVTSQPSADYTKLREALEASKVALGKAIATINKQNETLQTLKGQVGELRTGLDSSTLDQQTYLNEELTKAEQAQKALQQKLADAERENAALKLVVDGLKKQQLALEETQVNRVSSQKSTPKATADALPTQEGWKRLGIAQ